MKEPAVDGGAAGLGRGALAAWTGPGAPVVNAPRNGYAERFTARAGRPERDLPGPVVGIPPGTHVEGRTC